MSKAKSHDGSVKVEGVSMLMPPLLVEESSQSKSCKLVLMKVFKVTEVASWDADKVNKGKTEIPIDLRRRSKVR